VPRFGIPARRDHGHAGERSNETTQQGLLADHRGTSREPRGRNRPHPTWADLPEGRER
jgi:hypothetical protein